MKRVCKHALPLALWLAAGPELLGASEIFGIVWDSTGSALPHTRITAWNTETGIRHRTNSGETGRYSIPFLKQGTYLLSVRSPGFMITTVPDVRLDAEQQLRVDVTLLVAAVAESIQVTDMTLLDTASAEVGEAVPGKVIRELPLNGRNFTELLTTATGVTPVSSAQGARPGTTDADPTGIPGSRVLKPSLHGQQNRSVIYYLDGIVNTDFRVTTYGYLPSIDLLDSMRVHAHSDKVEWGGVTGGVISLASKSGTNEFRGTLFSFVRNSAFDARDPFKDANSDGPAPFRQNQFGVTYSGRIVRNKSFFSAGYEAWRYRKPTQSLGRVPTAEELAGDFSNSVIGQNIFDPHSTSLDAAGNFVRSRFPGNRIPGPLLSRRMQGFFVAYEERPNLVDPVSNFINSASSADDADSLQVKVDHRFSDKDNVFGRWSRMARNSVERIGRKASDGSEMVARNFGGGWIHVFGPKVVLSLRGGVARRDFQFDVQTHVQGVDGLAQLGFRDTERFEGLEVALTSPWGTSGIRGAAPRRNPTFNIAGDLTFMMGAHTLKFGGQWMGVERVQGNTHQIFRFADQVTGDPQNPGLTGASLASALLGLPSSFDGILPQDGMIHFRIPTYSLYVQDEWRANSRLTLNYGVRFDYSPSATILNGGLMGGIDIDRQVWLVGAQSMPTDCGRTGRSPCIPDDVPHRERIVLADRPNYLPNPVRDNWGPRIGAAYRVDDSTVLRGGYGLYWDALTSNSQYTQHNVNTWPVSRGFSGKANGLGDAPQFISDLEGNFPAVLPAASPWDLDTWSNDPDRKNALSHQWHVELQRQLTDQLMASAAYVGSANRRGEYSGLGNSATEPGPGTPRQVDARRPFPQAGGGTFYSRSIGESSYHALQVKARRRFAEGFQMMLSYTWSKSMDNGSSGWFAAENGPGGSSAAQNYHAPDSNRSVSSYNIPHFLSLYSVYELPLGKRKRYLSRGPGAWLLGDWQANLILQWRSGQPFNLSVPGDVANIGNSVAWWNYARPNLVGDPQPGRPTAERYYNPAAFDVPSLSYGDFGRNVLSSDRVFNADFSLFKLVPLAERKRLEIRLEAFNVFNHIDWAVPGTLVGRAGAGRVTSSEHPPRILQIGMKLHF